MIQKTCCLWLHDDIAAQLEYDTAERDNRAALPEDSAADISSTCYTAQDHAPDS